MKNLWGHFSTITKHKFLVTRLCFRCGLYKQGILHDLSKYSPTEFWAGVKYYQGNRSPIDKEKEVLGFSRGWLHHKGRNPHHWEYWLDITKNGIQPVKMPISYVVEMFCDRVAACMTYQKAQYTDQSALDYFLQGYDFVIMHEESKNCLHNLLLHLAQHGLDKTILYIKRDVLMKP